MTEEGKKESFWGKYFKKYGYALIAIAIILGGTAYVLIPEQVHPTACNPDSRFIEFYGSECPYCKDIAPIVMQVENEMGMQFYKLDLMNNTSNQQLFLTYNSSFQRDCNGSMVIPTFVSLKTRKALCGVVDKETLEKFVTDNC